MIHFAVDPGVNTGWARFDDERLVACGLTHNPSTLEVYGDELIIEKPQAYRIGHQKGDQNDLISVAIIVGRVVEQASASHMKVRTPTPREWKGQVPKLVHNNRVIAALTCEEYIAFCTGRKGIAPKLVHNILDAVGIGLWAVGRDANK